MKSVGYHYKFGTIFTIYHEPWTLDGIQLKELIYLYWFFQHLIICYYLSQMQRNKEILNNVLFNNKTIL